MNTLISRFGPRLDQNVSFDPRLDQNDIRFDPRFDQNDIRFVPQFIESEKKEYLGQLFKKIEEEKLQKRKEEIDLARKKAALTRFVKQNDQNWSDDDSDIDYSLFLIFDDNMDLSD
jgi:hypothetical protein